MKKFLFLLPIPLLFLNIIFAEAPKKELLQPSSSVALTSETPKTNDPSQPEILENPIRIVQPGENANIPALSSTYVCGSVPVGGILRINGQQIPVHPGGGFLTMINLTPGKFEINAELKLEDATYKLTRTIYVAGLEQAVSAKSAVIRDITPIQDQELIPGDFIEVTCKGSPGLKAYFTIGGMRKKWPMVESAPSIDGVYHGVYKITNKDHFKRAQIKITMIDENNKKVTKKGNASVSIFPSNVPLMAEVTSPNAILRAGPALTASDKAGYLMFPPDGTILQVTGRKGDEYRVRLTNEKTVWVSSNQIKLLPQGTPPVRSVIGKLLVTPEENSTLVHIPLSRKIPFKIEPDMSGKYLDISFYGAFSNTDWITNQATSMVRNLCWFQDDELTYRLRIYSAAKSWWGYDARYEGTELILELRTPPPLTDKKSILKGLTIAVDAGHGVGGGAMGVTGYAEGDANFAMVQNLKEKLLAKGARVILTRPGNIDVPLNERVKTAWQNRADVLVSLHNNSVGPSGNPFEKRGFGVYYFTPMSFSLAEAIHEAYIRTFESSEEFPLADDGLYYANLAMTRATQMPAVLIESAYMIVPEEEAYLKTDAFKSLCSEAIISGIENYLRSVRKVTD